MSYTNFIKAMELAPKCKFYTTAGGKNEEEIRIPIYNFDDGNMAYLDYSYLNEQKEPRVIMAFYNGKEYEIVETLAEDFGDFVLQLVQEQTEV